jgi:hypothetical protein
MDAQPRKVPAALVLLAAAAGVVVIWMAQTFLGGGVKAGDQQDVFNDGRRPRVSALLLIARAQPRVLGAEAPAQAMDEKVFIRYRQTQAALFRSRLVLNAALRDSKIAQLPLITAAKEPMSWLEHALRIDFPGDGEIMRVGMNGSQADQLAKLLDAVTKAYLSEIVNKERDRRNARLVLVEKTYILIEEQLLNRRTTLKRLQEVSDRTGAELPKAVEEQLLVQKLMDLARELRRLQLEKTAAETRLGRLPAKSRSPELEEQVAILGAQEKRLLEEDKRLRSGSLQQSGSNHSPELESLRDDIRQLERVQDRVADERESLRIERDAPARITLLEPACVRDPD